MSTKLSVLRHQSEGTRLARLGKDDWRTAIPVDAAKSLARALARSIDGEVRFDNGTRALYATDGSNYRQAPIGVVIPRHVQDVETTVRLAREHGAPILSRGGGTSLAGQCCNVAVAMDFSKYMHHVVLIDAEKKLGRVQPGCVLDHFRETAKKEAGLFFGPDPATHSRCTIGGMLGNNSCGSHSLLSNPTTLPKPYFVEFPWFSGIMPSRAMSGMDPNQEVTDDRSTDPRAGIPSRQIHR